MSSKYNYLKPLDLESVEFSVNINPAKMTKRIKTGVKKMLLGGYCKGGENAEAKMIAQRIMETYDIPHIRSNNYAAINVFAKHMLIPTAKERLEELIGACDVANKLEGRPQHYTDELSKFRLRLETTLSEDKNESVYFWLNHEDYAEPILSVFKEHNANNKEVSNTVNRLIEMIDNNSLIAIKLGKD